MGKTIVFKFEFLKNYEEYHLQPIDEENPDDHPYLEGKYETRSKLTQTVVGRPDLTSETSRHDMGNALEKQQDYLQQQKSTNTAAEPYLDNPFDRLKTGSPPRNPKQILISRKGDNKAIFYHIDEHGVTVSQSTIQLNDGKNWTDVDRGETVDTSLATDSNNTFLEHVKQMIIRELKAKNPDLEFDDNVSLTINSARAYVTKDKYVSDFNMTVVITTRIRTTPSCVVQ